MNAEIIGVGSELLLGQISNTDAQHISQRLAQLGIDIYYHTVIGDNRERLLKALSIASERADLIITTGGLGPTMDDITKECVAEFINRELVNDESSLQSIERFFKKVNREMTENNKKQALFPTDSIILPNKVGTAPGAIVEDNNKVFVILPGPLYELKPMFDNYVMPYLQNLSHDKIFSRVLRIYGIGESSVEQKISDLLKGQTDPTIAPLASRGEVTLRITAKCDRKEDPLNIILPIENEIRSRLGDAVYGVDDENLQIIVARLLKGKNIKLALAESCTGGLISNLLTDVPGISENFLEGFITYCNEAKINRLEVSPVTIKVHGAVSEQTAGEMAEGVRKTAHSDIGLAVTGIAGPGGGTQEKPVGLVYIGISTAQHTNVKRFNFQGDRLHIKYSTANAALDMLRRTLIQI